MMLPVRSLHAHLGSVGFAPDEAIGAADPEIDLTKGKGPAVRSEEPALNQFGLRPAVKEQPARRRKGARSLCTFASPGALVL
jgi:hypothetical protein